MSTSSTFPAFLAALLFTVGSSQLMAQDTPVLGVIEVDVEGNRAGYFEALQSVLQRAREVTPEAGTRVWEATQAGEDTGAIFVVTRHASLTALANAQTAATSDGEFMRRMQAVQESGRTVVSRSVLADRTPSYLEDQEPVMGPDVVAEITTVELEGSLQEYLEALEPLVRRGKELDDSAEIRIFQATFAGEDTGQVHVVVLSPSLEAWAKGNQVESDAEYQKHLAGVAATGRVIVSRSLLFDRTPR